MDLPLKSASTSVKDISKKEFQILLKDVKSESDIKKNIQVNYPPEQEGYLTISLGDTCICKKGPGFPDAKGHKVDVKNSGQLVKIILKKMEEADWKPIWQSFRNK